MCKMCNGHSGDCCIFIDPLDGEWYLLHQTYEWDSYNDEFVYDKIYIDYCPWCGRKLNDKSK